MNLLAGVFVHSRDKSGQDAGEIAGIEAMGVTATNDIEAVLAIDADVVIHTSLPSLVYGDDPNADMENFCRLLASGKNVIGAGGFGVYYFFTKDIRLLTGPVWFNETAINGTWKWTTQLDINLPSL